MSKRRAYAIQHRHTGRIYVGSTEQRVDERIMQHLWALRRGDHRNELMQEDFDKYGENYNYFELEEFDTFVDNQFVGRQVEYDYMEKFGTDNPAVGYNQNDPYFRRKQRLNVKKGEPIPNDAGFEEEE